MIEAIKEFQNKYGTSENKINQYFAPGRLNFIGEHLDYNGGFVLPFAIALGIKMFIRLNKSSTIKFASSLNETIYEINFQEELRYDKSKEWGNYPIGVIEYLKEKKLPSFGAEIYFTSNLPIGAGLSSSAAIEVVTAFALNDLFKLKLSKKEIALIGKKAENEFVGVNCGFMDQFAVTFAEKNNLMLLNCKDLSLQNIPLQLGDYEILIINTNTDRKLDGSKFNELFSACELALKEIQNHKEINFLVDATIEDLELIENEIAKKRAKHIVTEQQRVIKCIEALKENNFERVGDLMNKSHLSLKENYEVTGKYLDALHFISNKQKGCVGARMSGAGFAGCGFALVLKENAEAFKINFIKEFEKETGIAPSIYNTNAESGVRKIAS